MSDTADKIGKILEDPESLKWIAGIADSLMQTQDASKKDGAEPESGGALVPVDDAQNGEKKPSEFGSQTLLAAAGKKIGEHVKSGEVDNAIRVLTALRPYMNAHRRTTADSVLKWLRAAKTLGNADLAGLLGDLMKQPS